VVLDARWETDARTGVSLAFVRVDVGSSLSSSTNDVTRDTVRAPSVSFRCIARDDVAR
jgi:hypothetical protein